MAMIDKIRKKKQLLLVVIGIGMLGFLIPYDAVMALFGKGGPSTITVGTIDGEDITLDIYQQKLRDRREILTYQNDEGLKNAVWGDLIQEVVLADDYEALAITVGKEEYDELRFGTNISAFAQSVFYGGQVTEEARNGLRETMSSWYNSSDFVDRKRWEDYKLVLTAARMREKYDAMLKAGVYANNLDAKLEDRMKSEKVSFDFVVKKFADIPDSVITYTERDVKSYFDKHKSEKKYRQKVGRSIKYVTFNVAPSAEDSAEIKNMLSNLKPSFQAADNDSIFVITNSEVPAFNKRRYRAGDLAGASDAAITTASIDSVVGPYSEANAMKLYKVLARESAPEVNARHILLKGDETQMGVLRAKADSIKKVIKKDKNFAELATKFSEDPGSAAKGGDLDWFGKGRMVAPFEEACFNGKVGDMPIVQTQFGIHIIEITNRRDVQETVLAEIVKNVVPSANTLKNSYQEANDFAIAHSTEELFTAKADSMGGQEVKAIAPNATNIGSLQNAFSVVNWAYKAEIGEVSSPLPVGSLYVIALLTEKTEDGEPAFEAVKELMEEEVKKEKKAEMYTKIMSEGKNLEEVASAAETTVQSANDLALNAAAMPGGGANELKVIGTAFYLKQGEMSLPIEGLTGVYVIAPTTAITPATPKEDYSADKQTIITRLQGRVMGGFGVYNAMLEAADIKDERIKY
jgi:peptidyl-prolyl cis-trans isomerase D